MPGREGQLVERASAPPPDRSRGCPRPCGRSASVATSAIANVADSAADASGGDARPGRAADGSTATRSTTLSRDRRAGTRDAGLGGDPERRRLGRPAAAGGASRLGHRERRSSLPVARAAPAASAQPMPAAPASAVESPRTLQRAVAALRESRCPHPRVREPRHLTRHADRARGARDADGCAPGPREHRAPTSGRRVGPARRSPGLADLPSLPLATRPEARRPAPNRRRARRRSAAGAGRTSRPPAGVQRTSTPASPPLAAATLPAAAADRSTTGGVSRPPRPMVARTTRARDPLSPGPGRPPAGAAARRAWRWSGHPVTGRLASRPRSDPRRRRWPRPARPRPAPTPWTPDQALRMVQRSTGPAGPALPRGVGVARNSGGSRRDHVVAPARIATAGPDMPHVTATTSSPAGDPVVQRVAAPGPAGMTLTAIPVLQREAPADTQPAAATGWRSHGPQRPRARRARRVPVRSLPQPPSSRAHPRARGEGPLVRRVLRASRSMGDPALNVTYQVTLDGIHPARRVDEDRGPAFEFDLKTTARAASTGTSTAHRPGEVRQRQDDPSGRQRLHARRLWIQSNRRGHAADDGHHRARPRPARRSPPGA